MLVPLDKRDFKHGPSAIKAGENRIVGIGALLVPKVDIKIIEQVNWVCQVELKPLKIPRRTSFGEVIKNIKTL